MSIYKELIESASKGSAYNISLQDKSLTIKGKSIIKKGEYNGDEPLIEPSDLDGLFYKGTEEDCDIEFNPWGTIQYLYEMYKYSVPDKRWNERKSVFKALPSDLLSDEDLAINHNRHLACAMLEGYILLASLQGWLTWTREDHWYWVNMYDRECIVLRQWVE